MLLPKFLKIQVSKMTISSILRQISYLCNTIFFACKLHFCKKNIPKKKLGGESGGGGAPCLGAATASKTFKDFQPWAALHTF